MSFDTSDPLDATPREYERPVSSRSVFDGKLLHVRLDNVVGADGIEHTREYIVHPGAVMVIPVLDDGRIIFERQFRYPLHRVLIELPAGKIDPGEGIEDTARRELREETGYEADEWRHLGVMHPCIGYSDERIEIFLARGLRQKGSALDHGEYIEVIELTLDEAIAGVMNGGITDGKTVAGIFWAERVLGADR